MLFRSSATNWGPDFQMVEPAGTFFTQTTTPGTCCLLPFVAHRLLSRHLMFLVFSSSLGSPHCALGFTITASSIVLIRAPCSDSTLPHMASPQGRFLQNLGRHLHHLSACLSMFCPQWPFRTYSNMMYSSQPSLCLGCFR